MVLRSRGPIPLRADTQTGENVAHIDTGKASKPTIINKSSAFVR
jgi:hypothetical protein